MLEKIVDIKHEHSHIKVENVILSGKVDSCATELKAVKDQSSQFELKQDRMEMLIRKNNLKIHGIENIDTLQQDHADQSVRQHLTNNFGRDGNTLELNAVYKLPGRLTVLYWSSLRDNRTVTRYLTHTSRNARKNLSEEDSLKTFLKGW